MTTDYQAIDLGDETPPPTEPSESNLKATLTAILSFTQGLVPLLVAIFVLWYFGTVMKRMFGLTGPTITEVEWGRNAYLYGGVEALAYAAAGFLFGREVNRQRAERAEESADSARRESNSAQRVAAQSVANGRALAEGVRELESAQGAKGAPAAAAGVLASPPATEVRMLRGMADRFFPPLTGTK
ncbi:MAG TPA: hypothetical protein VGX92_21735 [Pyrinomonadaceae bacterium]|jgi:hypothetical protein|nr:hypothetical protein [Pyrinomonadaceae bacterium]